MEGIEGKPVSWYSEVFDLVFPGINKAQANDRWKEHLKQPPGNAKEEEQSSEGN